MRHLPASWRDTHNQLEKLLFLAKDLPLVIDDWAPGQDSAKARELEVKAEYIVRAQGNRQGRGRMRADTSSRPNYVPRGLLITTGEQLPGGHSHTARIFTVEIECPGVCLDFMSAAQEHHQQQYCVAMSHYINWIKQNWGDLKKSLPGRWRDLRDKAQQGSNHPRLPEAIASLSLAVELAAEFALEYKAISASESSALQKTAWDIFYRLASQQASRVEEERPGKRFIETLRALFDQGKAILWDKNDEAPRTVTPGTVPVGWKDGADHVLLNPATVYQAVHEFGQKSGEPFTFKKTAVFQDLKRLGYIECVNGRSTDVSWIYGRSVRVIRLKRECLNDDVS